MHKRKLKLDSLTVDSFATGGGAPEKGTVRGHSGIPTVHPYTCTCTHHPSEPDYYSCHPECPTDSSYPNYICP
jgi:hypothetical protein